MRRLAAVTLLLNLAVMATAGGCPSSSSSTQTQLGLIPAPAGEVAAIVKSQLATSRARGRRALVLVGAPWCEPCVRFHDAAKRGELDAALGDVDLVEFNADDDAERLRAAGCGSPMIPLLAVPDDDGRCSDRRMSGSVKGDGAVPEMLPRLQALLR